MAVANQVPPPMWQAFIEAFPGCSCIIRSDGAVVGVNRAWRDDLGDQLTGEVTPDRAPDYLGFIPAAISDADATRATIASIDSALAGRIEPQEIEYSVVVDDVLRSFVARVSRFDVQGERWILLSRNDVTDPSSARLGAAAARREYEELVQSLDGIVWELVLDTFEFTFVSEKSKEILGYPPEAWYEKGFWESKIHPDDRDWAMTFCAASTARRENHEFTYRLTAADGRDVWLHDIVTVVVTGGRPVKLRGVMFDVSREKEAEQKREAIDRSYRQLVELSPWPIAIHQDGRIVLCNDATIRAFGGRSSADIVGQPVIRFVLPEDRGAVQERSGKVIATGLALPPREYDFVRLDGSTFPGEVFVGHAMHDGRPSVQLLIQDLTERRQSERAIRASERLLRETLETLNLIAVAFDRDGRVTFCNETLLRVTGLTRDEVIGAEWFSTFIPPEIAEDVKPTFSSFFQGDTPVRHYENEIVTKRGTRHLVEWSNTAVRDADGRAIGVASIGEDVTDRRTAERELAARAEQYSAILTSTTDGFWLTDAQYRILDVNENYARMSGYSREELLSMSVADLEAMETPQAVDQPSRKLATQGCDRFETTHRRKDGIVYDVEVSTSVEPSGRFVVFVRDITARKNAENALLASEQRLRTIVDNAPFGAHVWELDRSGGLVFLGANAAAGRILRIDHVNLTGKRIEEAFPGLPDEVTYTYRAVAEHGGFREIEHVAYSEGLIAGVFEVHAAQIAPRRVAAFFKDITERKRAEYLREALYQIADTAASCERLDELYRRIHEILTRLIYAKNFFVAIKESDAKARFDYFVDERDENPGSIDLVESRIGQVLRAGTPMRIPTEVFEQTERRGEVGRLETPSVDWLGVPLARGGEIFGVLAVQSYDPGIRFTDADVDLLGFVSQNIASAITRTSSVIALQQAEETQRAILQGNPDTSFLVDLDGKVLFGNEAFARLVGYVSSTEAVGRNAFDRLPIEVALLRRAKMDAAVHSGTTVQFEDTCNERHYANVICPVRDPGGAITRCAIFARDRTEEVLAGRAIQESEERFRATFEQAAVGMVHTTLDGHFLRVNQRFCDIVGYSRDELLGMTFREITHPDDLSPDLENLGRLVSGGIDTFTMEKRYIRKDGGLAWVSLTVSLVRFDPFEEPRVLGVVEDITDRRRADHEMRVRDAAIESSRTAICISGLDGAVTYANPAFLMMWGYTVEQVRDRSMHEFWEVPDRAATVAQEVLLNGSWTGELRACRADGTLFDADVLNSLVYDAHGRAICMMGVFADVTERLKTERELRRFRQALDASADAILVVDRRSLKFVDVNRTAESMTGYSRDELLAMGPSELSPRTDPDEIARRFDQVLGEREGVRIEALHRRADGAECPVEIVLKAVGSDDPLVIASARDISERRRAEETLREREALFEAVFQTNNAIKLLVDPMDGTIVDANAAAVEFYGYGIDRLRGMSLSSINAGPPVTLDADMTEAARREQTYDEFRHRIANGEVRDVEVYSGPIAMEGRTVLFSIIHDVTERRTSESKLRQLAVAIENVPDAIYITDARATMNYHNRALETITGYSTAELVGATPSLFKSGQHDAAFYRRMWEVIMHGRVWSGRVINRRKDGTIYHEQKTIAPIHGSEGTLIGFVSVGRDVSEELALEARLRESQKLEAIGQLAGGIAHDFNNLLQGIFSYLDLASLQIREEAPDAMPDIEQVRRSAARAATLTKQLLAFSRRQLLELRSIRLNDLVASFLRMFHRVIRENIDLRFEPDSSATVVRADSSQLEQVILNLCLNARDAMPDGGQLTLATFVEDIPCDSSRLSMDMLPGRYVTLRVTDTGVGMDDWTRRRVFEPFFTTKGPGRGSGLGLAMVFGIVRQHHGFVEVESAPGKGATFTIYLPESSAELVEPVNTFVDTVPLGGSELILFAEDSELIRNAVERVLKSNGYRVLTVGDGVDAVAAFEANRAQISVVLLDVVMPRLSGREAWRQIHDIDPDVPVLFCSGYDPETEQTRFIVEGGFELLQKPFDNISLLRKIRKTIDSRH